MFTVHGVSFGKEQPSGTLNFQMERYSKIIRTNTVCGPLFSLSIKRNYFKTIHHIFFVTRNVCFVYFINIFYIISLLLGTISRAKLKMQTSLHKYSRAKDMIFNELYQFINGLFLVAVIIGHFTCDFNHFLFESPNTSTDVCEFCVNQQ